MLSSTFPEEEISDYIAHGPFITVCNMATVKPQEQYPDREPNHGRNLPIESIKLGINKPISGIGEFLSPHMM